MQVAQSKILRLVDDDGIGIGNVDTTLNDSRSQQHIVVIVDKIEDNLFQFLRLHLSVSDAHPAVRNIPLNHGLQFPQVLNPVVHKKDLSVTAHFKVDGLGNDFLIKGMHLCLNRIPVGRRSLDNRQVTGSHQ